MWAVCGLALAESLSLARNPHHRQQFLSELRRSLPWAAGLAVIQVIAIALAMLNPAFEALGRFAALYLIFTLILPPLWAVGKVHAFQAALPRKHHSWPAGKRWLIFSALAAGGVILSLLLVILVPVHPGESVTTMAEGASDGALALLALWLMINAPWQEELLFRHYLVARVAAFAGEGTASRRAWTLIAIVFAAAIFALGHSAHMDPAWPKLAQTFAWGLALGWVRVAMGTSYAIGLHLVWNLTAPLVAPFVGT